MAITQYIPNKINMLDYVRCKNTGDEFCVTKIELVTRDEWTSLLFNGHAEDRIELIQKAEEAEKSGIIDAKNLGNVPKHSDKGPRF